MADSMLAHAAGADGELLTQGQTRPAGTDKLSGGLPCYGLYRTRDGRHLAVGALERKFWDCFCDVLGREDLKPLHLPATPPARQALRAEVAEIIGVAAAGALEQRFAAASCCVRRCSGSTKRWTTRTSGPAAWWSNQPDGGPANSACPVKMSGYTFEVRRPHRSPANTATRSLPRPATAPGERDGAARAGSDVAAFAYTVSGAFAAAPCGCRRRHTAMRGARMAHHHELQHHTIASSRSKQILLGARAVALDIEALLQRAGISPALLESPLSRVTQAQYAALHLRPAPRDARRALGPVPPPAAAGQLRAWAAGCYWRARWARRCERGLRYYRLLLADFVPRAAGVRDGMRA